MRWGVDDAEIVRLVIIHVPQMMCMERAGVVDARAAVAVALRMTTALTAP